MYRSHVLICGGTGCTSSNSQKIIEAMEKEIAAQGLAEEVKVVRTGCFGLCALGPIMIVYPEGCFYSRVTVEDVPEIVSEHLLKGRIVTRLLYDETVDKENDTVKSLNETDFYKKQVRVALRNCGVINPESIDEYIAYDGYQALAKCLTEYTPEQVIQVITDSGLRGRGGGGFPTGRKWALCAPNKAPQKSAPPRALSTSGRNIPSRCAACRSPSIRPGRRACWARTSSAPASISTWRSGWAPAPLSAARKPL